MLQKLTIEEALEARSVIIDVRSEAEFADSLLPGALSLPLLQNDDRAKVGTLYKKVGAPAALDFALGVFEKRAGALVEEFTRIVGGEVLVEALAPAKVAVRKSLFIEDGAVKFREPTFLPDVRDSRKVIFYCWRGGARSKSVALLFRALGFNTFYVEGGHKAFRRKVLDFLDGETYPFKLCTLYGLTGCGKTKILQGWQREGRPVIDLEALAFHRGSAFGQIGIATFGEQKKFENCLYLEMRRWARAGAHEVFVEGESRRIGRVQLPARFMQAMLEGRHIKVERSIDERVALILSDYVDPVPREEWLAGARRSLESIRRRLGDQKYHELLLDLNRGDNATLVRKLLVDYYDKAYLLSREDSGFYDETI